MRVARGSTLRTLVVTSCLALMAAGCGLIDVEMTSAPDTVRSGEPVTFDVELTNRSQCPTKRAVALLLAFIPIGEFNAELSPELPPDAPPEFIEFLEELRAFFDELCSGGEPPFPEPPEIAVSCTRGDAEMICTAQGPAPAQQGSSGGLTLSALGDRLRCDIDDGTMRCELRIPLPSSARAAGGTAAAPSSQPLSCLTAEELGGVPGDIVGGDALCFLGTFPMFEGLDPGEMAAGQVTLPARGSGRVRNLIVSIPDEEEDYGVCKGGSNPGDACLRDDPTDCQGGGSCGEGICDGGPNDGKGCDKASEAADCPGGGTCELCAEPTGPFLPIDCTETYISPEPAPIASPWGLATLAVVLFAAGLWLQRRRVRRA